MTLVDDDKTDLILSNVSNPNQLVYCGYVMQSSDLDDYVSMVTIITESHFNVNKDSIYTINNEQDIKNSVKDIFDIDLEKEINVYEVINNTKVHIISATFFEDDSCFIRIRKH